MAANYWVPFINYSPVELWSAVCAFTCVHFRKFYDVRRQQGGVEERWTELKEALAGLAEQHLQRRRVAKKRWISDGTLELVEAKRMAFQKWQEHHINVEKQTYQALCKRVGQALKIDKEKWLEEEMREMEEDIRRDRHGNIFRRMRKLRVVG